MTTDLPTIYRRAEHPISRQLLSQNALRTLYRLQSGGYQAYLVGGCVRDLLLGREPKDFDVATDATPNQVKKLFRNCRLVGRRFRLAHLHFGDELIEVATFRAMAGTDQDEEEVAAGERSGPPHILHSEDGLLLRDNLFGTPAEDAQRRDFTVNGLFYNIADFSVLDYVGGMADLQDGMIRTIGDPWVRFTEDPVRMLRAVRFAALLSFRLEDETWSALLDLAPNIAKASPARLYEEFLKLFLSGEAGSIYQILRRARLFEALLPHFSAWLEADPLGFAHQRISQSLEWIDEKIQGGEKVEPALLLALLFSTHLEERAAAFHAGGLTPNESFDQAVALFVTETSDTILINRRTALTIREIFVLQRRFERRPGRNALGVLRRPGFAAALDFLSVSCAISGASNESPAWWAAFSRQQGEAVPASTSLAAGEGTVRKRSRRRRNRRRRAEPA